MIGEPVVGSDESVPLILLLDLHHEIEELNSVISLQYPHHHLRPPRVVSMETLLDS